MAKTKILYIMGNGRSGSTILGNVLNEIEGFFTAGELRQVWEANLRNQSTCACGETLDKCEVWSEIIASAFGDVAQIDINEMIRLYNQHGKNRNVPRLIFPSGKKVIAKHLETYLANLTKLYTAIADITQSQVIVDTSKQPSYSALVDMLPDTEVYVLHLVRDPRAVAYSWGSKKFKPDDGQYMKQLSPYVSALRWLTWNIGGRLLWLNNHEHYLRIHYEDFTRQPRSTIEQILQFIGETPETLPFISEDKVLLGSNHIAIGNPNRMDSVGEVQIKYDARWKTKMSAINKAIVVLITFPLLVWYQYFLGKRA